MRFRAIILASITAVICALAISRSAPAQTSPFFGRPNPGPTPCGFPYQHGCLPSTGTAWFPYSPNPFAVRICTDPCSPTFDAHSSNMVPWLFASTTITGGFGLGEVQEAAPIWGGGGDDLKGHDDTYPIYYATNSDPSYTPVCNIVCSFPDVPIHIPNGAHASNDHDHHMIVINQSNGIEYGFWEFNGSGNTGTNNPVSGGGSVNTGGGGECFPNDYTGGSPNSCNTTNGKTGVAAKVPQSAGPIDPNEWATIAKNIRLGSGSEVWSHEIYIALPCPGNIFTWPAAGTDGNCFTDGTSQCDNVDTPLCTPIPAWSVPDGELIWLDLTDAQIDSCSGAKPWVKAILHAMHQYGFMVVDSGNDKVPGGNPSELPDPWTFYGVDNATWELWGGTRGWDTFFDELVNQEGQSVSFSTGPAYASHLEIPVPSCVTQSNIHIVVHP